MHLSNIEIDTNSALALPDELLNPNDWLRSYLDSIIQYSSLSQEELKNLFIKMENGDTTAREKIIVSNLRLAYHIAKIYKPKIQNFDFQDIIQEANLGLTKAVDKYDYRKGVTFSTYASYWIRQSIIRAIPSNCIPFYILQNKSTLISKVRKCSTDMAIELERFPTYDEIAEALNIPVEEVIALTGIFRVISLDIAVGSNSENNRDLSIGETISDESISDFSDVFNYQIAEFVSQKLTTSIISPKERNVIKMYFGIDGYEPMTFQEIASTMNVSRQRVFTIYSKGFKKLELICSNYTKEELLA